MLKFRTNLSRPKGELGYFFGAGRTEFPRMLKEIGLAEKVSEENSRNCDMILMSRMLYLDEADDLKDTKRDEGGGSHNGARIKETSA